LTEHLDRGADARLTLVVGSAGTGKTILLTDWLSTRPDQAAAWLSCDVADGDPLRFVAALSESLQRAAGEGDLGEDARQLLAADGQVSPDIVSSLADDVDRIGAPQVLVVDDFHLTGAAGIDVLTCLLECRPPSLQVVLSTRVDPALRLHRMRASEELVEVRERELSFSVDETGRLLARFGLQLSDADAAAMQRRSEGWVAGLQMAAISIRNGSDPGGGDHGSGLGQHTVTGYFLEEVLYRQPDEIVQFMLTTSILDELSVAICTALCGQGAAALLERVYRDHLFLSVVDEEAGTYRYHQLIKEVLRAELRARNPEAERELHERAADHLTQRGQAGSAARHLFEAGDAAAAFRVLSAGVLVDFGTNPALVSALDDIQPDDFAGSPEILLALAAEMTLRGNFDRGLRAFELATASGAEDSSDPDIAFRFAVVGATSHHLRGEEDEALRYREQAHKHLGRTSRSEDWIVSLEATGAFSHMNLGNFEEAVLLAEWVRAAKATPPNARAIFYPGILSQVALARGELSEADAWVGQGVAAVRRFRFDRHQMAFNLFRVKALLALERHDLDTATQLTERCLDMQRPFLDFLAQVDRARIWAARGSLDEALASLPAARAALRSDRSCLLAQADELEARMRLALGDLGGAATIAGRLPDDRRSTVSAMIHLHTGHPDLAQSALADLPLQPATIRSRLELQLLRADLAVVRHSDDAPRLVRETLDVVQCHGFMQTVLDTAPHVVEHLMSEPDLYPRSAHLETLVGAAVESRQGRTFIVRSKDLADPLTEAELRVLRLLPQRVSYGDIASDLHLSLNTVKTHLRRCYMKLGVTSRSAAIKRASSLGML
jgi:LuxR family maltose regulon positive regulatory protein